jgi:hypothetical protein
MGIEKADFRVLFNVSFIVLGVIIASFGEIEFVLIGVLFQIGGIIFEAIRLVMVQRLLSSSEYKMDPLVSLYYFAPICACMNFCVALVFELPRIPMEAVYAVGVWRLVANAMVAFALNVSVVFLVRSILHRIAANMLICTDWPNIGPGHDTLWRAQGYPPRWSFNCHLGDPGHGSPILRIQHSPWRTGLLQARRIDHQDPAFRDESSLGRIWCQASCSSEADRVR